MRCHVSCWQTTSWAPTNHVFHNACDVIRREVLGTDILEQQCKQTKVLWMILTACVWKNVKRRDCEIFLGVRAHKTIPLPCCCVCRGTGKISHCCDLSTTFGTSHLSWQGKKFSSSFGSLCSSFCQDVLRCPKWGIGPTPYICRTGVIMCGLNPLLLPLKPCLFFHSFPAELNASWHCLYIRICHSNFSTWSTATRGQHV